MMAPSPARSHLLLYAEKANNIITNNIITNKVITKRPHPYSENVPSAITTKKNATVYRLVEELNKYVDQ
ncbi:MAG: hypothetical protein LUC24_06035, partial [Bacteroidales bacterium]|nr:hypothetical protein [Bacteroidales bacterium]